MLVDIYRRMSKLLVLLGNPPHPMRSFTEGRLFRNGINSMTHHLRSKLVSHGYTYLLPCPRFSVVDSSMDKVCSLNIRNILLFCFHNTYINELF